MALLSEEQVRDIPLPMPPAATNRAYGWSQPVVTGVGLNALPMAGSGFQWPGGARGSNQINDGGALRKRQFNGGR
jgi:hypothetical protein